MNQVKIDYQLLVQLCKEKESWTEEIILRNAFIFIPGVPYENYIIASYKNIAWPDFVLSLDEYLPRLKQKERETKLNNILVKNIK